MSARSLRRSQAAAYGAAPAVPVAEIRSRKWTKQLKTVGHITIPKWVPDQEHPTKALQKGTFKKTKGRKRASGEVGRMTRSVRQHLDAPLELLSEFPMLRHSSRHTSPAQAAAAAARAPLPTPGLPPATPAASATTATSSIPDTAQSSTAPVKAEAAVSAPQAPAPGQAAAVETTGTHELKPEAQMISSASTDATPAIPMMSMMPSVSNQLMTDVPSDEQLEMVLDDLPMLDADDSFPLDALDPAFMAPSPVDTTVASTAQGEIKAEGALDTEAGDHNTQKTPENSDPSPSEEDDGSANSATSVPSVSPASSTVPSRSPSP